MTPENNSQQGAKYIQEYRVGQTDWTEYGFATVIWPPEGDSFVILGKTQEQSAERAQQIMDALNAREQMIQMGLLKAQRPENCTHPIDKILEHDGSWHCFDCRTTWHRPEDLPPHITPNPPRALLTRQPK